MPLYTMPMLGVMRLILDREVGSASGEEDFFSVARTMPLVAGWGEVLVSLLLFYGLVWMGAGGGKVRGGR
jgi:hypothetical protein